MKRHATTIKDIARKLNISPSTVSRALKDKPEINIETRLAVKRVAKELNYQPNSLALSLLHSKSNTIGVIVPEIIHFFFSTVISGIEDVSRKRGYNVIIAQSNESAEQEISNLQTMFSNRVDGILVSISKASHDLSHFETSIENGLPIVFFDRVAENLKSSKVTVDDFMGGYQATEHLLAEGYRRIAHSAGPKGLDITTERLEGYKKAHVDAGIEFDERLVIYDMNSNEFDHFKAIYDLVKDQNPDGLFASNDLAAMSGIKAAQKCGKQIPEDFGVVGFSNWQFTELTNPSISTIEQSGYKMGQCAAELLLKQIDSKEDDVPTEIVKLPTRLIVRDSSKKN